MEIQILHIILPTITAAIAAPFGAWVNSKMLRAKYDLELGQLRAEMEHQLSEVKKSELDNVREASNILMEQIVKPLKTEIKSLRKDVDKFAKAVEKIADCPHGDSCPVRIQLRSAEGDSTTQRGETGK